MFADGMPMPQLVMAVRDTPLLTREEAAQAQALELQLAEQGRDRPVALEAWLLKVAMTAQYAAGVLERLELPPKALQQFYAMFLADQEERVAALFKDRQEQGRRQLALRMQAYDQALHTPSGDPGNAVAALFCRFLGTDNLPALADFCHDLCSELNRVFADELKRLAGLPREEA